MTQTLYHILTQFEKTSSPQESQKSVKYHQDSQNLLSRDQLIYAYGKKSIMKWLIGFVHVINVPGLIPPLPPSIFTKTSQR